MFTVFKYEQAYELPRSGLRYELPPRDLVSTLVNAFFQNVNLYSPILHRGLFEQQLADDLHAVDNRFAALVLLVCACGSRTVADARVLLPNADTRSAGWTFFEQVELLVSRFRAPSVPDLVDIQLQAVSDLGLTNRAWSDARHTACRHLHRRRCDGTWGVHISLQRHPHGPGGRRASKQGACRIAQSC